MKCLASVVGVSLLLASCATVPPGSTADVGARARQIQEYTRLACKFVPTIATIANILSTGASAPLTVIAQDICLAVTTAPLADGGARAAKVVYNGRVIQIKGKYVL